MHSNSISFPQKRQRSGSSAEISQGSKRKSSHPPVAYWDNLSKIWLTAESLRELDRRTSSAPGFQHAELKKEHLHFAPDFLRDCSPTRLREIKSLATSGGPDLTGLRNVRSCYSRYITVLTSFKYPLPQTMSSRVQKPYADPPLSETTGNTKTTTKTTVTSAYSRNFE